MDRPAYLSLKNWDWLPEPFFKTARIATTKWIFYEIFHLIPNGHYGLKSNLCFIVTGQVKFIFRMNNSITATAQCTGKDALFL